MEFTAESYRSASQEHLETAKQFHLDGVFYLAHYFAGLSVECMLRAYLRRIDPEFYPVHNLSELATRSRYFDIVPSDLHIEYGAEFNILNLRWRSNHRFATSAQLYAYLSEVKADFNCKGDRFKQNSRTLLNSAIKVTQLGESKWT